MITFSNGKLIMNKYQCANCKKKIYDNGLEPVYFKSDYYHFNCAWKKKKDKPIDKRLKTKQEIQEWIKNTKAEIVLKNKLTKA